MRGLNTINFFGVSHKYGIEHMLKQTIMFQRMKNELRIFYFKHFFFYSEAKSIWRMLKAVNLDSAASDIIEILTTEIQFSLCYTYRMIMSLLKS